MHSSEAALYSPLKLGGIAQEFISSSLKNCTIIHCLKTLTRKVNFIFLCLIGVET